MLDTSENKRVVAIVGRPNVGKSALFNRIVGRRIAIVHEQSGVTRDRLACEAEWYDKHFDLIDTGGIGMMDGERAGDTIEDGTREQVDLAIEDAVAVILVVDVTAGLLPLDQEVAGLLHQSGKPVVVAVNKADHAALDDKQNEFAGLGYPTIPISVLHKRGMDDLLEAVLEYLPPGERVEQEEPLRVAVVGRPNAGKSSYVNRLLNNKRTIVSEIPGTTRDSIEIPFTVGHGDQSRRYVLVDTAGIRKFRKAKDAVEKYSINRAERSIERADVVVMMMDATEGPRRQNKKIASLVLKHNKGCIILVNKWDLAEEVTTQRRYGQALRDELPYLNFVPIVFTSALSGYNIRRTIDAVDYVAAQVQTQLSTGLLNRVIQQAVQQVQPPVIQNCRLKIFYVTQVATKPVTIRFFVNTPKRITDNYRAYLTKKIREAFGLEGAPIVLQFRARSTEKKWIKKKKK
jgi:GTP-binding protein